MGEPISWFCSTTSTDRPRQASASAAESPAGPAPAMIASCIGLHKVKNDPGQICEHFSAGAPDLKVRAAEPLGDQGGLFAAFHFH